ncbi:MAG TPA: glycosyltransferase family 2 protein [Gemmatimonadales bacterium]|nr:glycosyltransferase family 2 protein [Gemmatimonadales bacterium]
MLSIVLPVHNERDSLEPLLAEIEAVFADRPHEIVAVDDGSTDGSLDALRALRAAHPALRLVALRRRSGQSAALLAGFEAARGEIVVMLDADGQNDPADAPRLLNALEACSRCAAVVGYRTGRRDSPWKLLQSRIANSFRNWLTGDRIRDTGCGLKVMRRAAVLRLPRFVGMHRFFPTLLRMGGDTVLELPVSQRPRRYGTSKYGMWNRAFRGLRDAFGVRWLKARALHYEIREDIG